MSTRRQLRTARHWLTICLLAICVFSLFSLAIDLDTPKQSMPQINAVSHAINDIYYCAGEASQALDLYLPHDTDESPHPLVVYVHGGGWSRGDKRNEIADYYGSALVEAGFAFASVNYRLAPKYHFPAQNDDVACAIKTLAERAAEYDIDTNHVILVGDSAGGLLVSDYALSDDEPPVNVRGVVSFYGTTDLVYQLNQTHSKNKNAYNYLGTKSSETARRASPLYREITRTPPPFLFFHGTNDKVVSISQAYKFYEKIAAQQPTSRFIRVKHAGHGFSNSSSPTRAEIRNLVVEFTRKVSDNETPTASTPEITPILLDVNTHNSNIDNSIKNIFRRKR